MKEMAGVMFPGEWRVLLFVSAAVLLRMGRFLVSLDLLQCVSCSYIPTDLRKCEHIRQSSQETSTLNWDLALERNVHTK